MKSVLYVAFLFLLAVSLFLSMGILSSFVILLKFPRRDVLDMWLGFVCAAGYAWCAALAVLRWQERAGQRK